MKKIILCTIALFAIINTSSAQSFDLRFNLTSVDCNTNQACYDVQVRSVNGSAFNMAGQNYRIYYNNALADYSSGVSLLPASDYGTYNVVQDQGPVDATAFSTSLGFESTLGFLNYEIDLNDLANGGIMIPASGAWVSTSNLCFAIDPSAINTPTECIELVWAKDNYTNSLATAFNEISQWVGTNDTDPVTPTAAATHDNLDSSDGDAACFDISCAAAAVADVSISDVTVTEGQTAVVQVCQSIISNTAVTVVYSTMDGSAVSIDYSSATNQSVVIPAGQLCTTISVATNDDSLVENVENFSIQIQSVSAGNIADGTGVVTINDNDTACNAQAPVISLN